MQTIAESVENAADARRASPSSGIDYAQGYFVAEPEALGRRAGCSSRPRCSHEPASDETALPACGGRRRHQGDGRARSRRAVPGRRSWRSRVYACQEFSGLQPIIADFLQQPPVARHAEPSRPPVLRWRDRSRANSATLTNLGWRIAGDALAAELRLPEVRARSTISPPRGSASRGSRRASSRPCRRAARWRRRPRLIIGAGTGLGVGLLTWQDDGYAVHPRKRVMPISRRSTSCRTGCSLHLRRTYGRVSYERVVSGPGLMRIFSFLQETGAGVPSRQLRDADKTAAGHGGGDRGVCAREARSAGGAGARSLRRDLRRVRRQHGARHPGARRRLHRRRDRAQDRSEAAGRVLSCAPSTSKGRFSELLATMPVHVVMNPQVGLYGALLEAGRLAGGTK